MTPKLKKEIQTIIDKLKQDGADKVSWLHISQYQNLSEEFSISIFKNMSDEIRSIF